MWLKSYLDLSRSRPKWACVVDAIYAKSASAASRTVEHNAKSNLFLQNWDVSARACGPLPGHLKRMVDVGRKYQVKIDVPVPDEALRLAMPIWYHFGEVSDLKQSANSPAAKCLRQKHNVRTVQDCQAAARRIQSTLNGGQPHTPKGSCVCLDCMHDRTELGCEHPHACAAAAERALERLSPLWKHEECLPSDGLSLTKRRQESNETARAENGAITFNPAMSVSLPIANGFRMFGPIGDARTTRTR
ncbi:hypothetical protein FKP32DRAFT_1546256, partial [Trametes sanguinea]